jgi:hypothetical protein
MYSLLKARCLGVELEVRYSQTGIILRRAA